MKDKGEREEPHLVAGLTPGRGLGRRNSGSSAVVNLGANTAVQGALCPIGMLVLVPHCAQSPAGNSPWEVWPHHTTVILPTDLSGS